MKRMGDLVGKLVHKKVFSLQIQCVSLLVVGGQLGWCTEVHFHLTHLVLGWNMTEKEWVGIFDQNGKYLVSATFTRWFQPVVLFLNLPPIFSFRNKILHI